MTPRPPARTRRLRAALVLAAGAAVVAAVVATRPERTAQPVAERALAVQVAEARREERRVRVLAHGAVAPHTESDLAAEVAGRVVWISPQLSSGGRFAAGEPLVRLAPADLDASLEQAAAALALAESRREQAALALARIERLAGEEVASQARLDDARAALRVVEAERRSAAAAFSRARRDRERAEITAPYAGRSHARHVDLGELVARGTKLATLHADDFAEVRLPVRAQDLALLGLAGWPREGVPPPAIELRATDATDAGRWPARFDRIEAGVDARSQMAVVVARIDDPSARRGGEPLAMGRFVEALLEASIAEKVFVLPRLALVGADAVAVLDAESRLHLVPVRGVRSVGDEVWIEDGLEAGQRVVLDPPPTPTAGLRLEAAPLAVAGERPEAGS
jgi:RND family efflux transporter MFP subunit